jgi:hypothetical protein
LLLTGRLRAPRHILYRNNSTQGSRLEFFSGALRFESPNVFAINHYY